MNTIDQLISKMPQDAEFCLVILPDEDGNFRIIYYGLTSEDAAKACYHVADEIVRQKIPLPIKGLNS